MSNSQSAGKVFYRGAILNNPVLIQCAGLCPAIAGASNLKDAFFLSLFIAADLIVCCFTASALLKKIPRYIRVAVYLLIGLAIVCPALWFIENKTFIEFGLGMKIIIPLVAVNSVTAIHCETFSVKHDVKSAFSDSLAASFGTAFVLLICGLLREIIGNGSIAGLDFDTSLKLSGFAMPFGCLVLLGFMAAALKSFISAVTPSKPSSSAASSEKTENIIEEVEINEEETMTEQVELGLADYDEIDSILSTTDEFLMSLLGSDGGDEK